MEYKKELKGIPAVFILNSDCSVASTRGRGVHFKVDFLSEKQRINSVVRSARDLDCEKAFTNCGLSWELSRCVCYCNDNRINQ